MHFPSCNHVVIAERVCILFEKYGIRQANAFTAQVLSQQPLQVASFGDGVSTSDVLIASGQLVEHTLSFGSPCDLGSRPDYLRIEDPLVKSDFTTPQLEFS